MVDLIEICLMTIAYLALFNCILRSDYNLVVALVCFFYWNSRQTKQPRVANIIYIVMVLVTIFDIIWLILIWSSWTTTTSISQIWQRLRFWHITIIITTIINMVLKLATCVLVFLQVKKESKSSYQPLHEKIQSFIMNLQETLYLGFLEDPEEDCDLSLKFLSSYAGGIPQWLHYNDSFFPPEIKCLHCDQLMKFLLQIFAPFKSAYYRYIYLFFCFNDNCKSKQIRAFRCQLPFNNEFFDKSEKMIFEDKIRFSTQNEKYLLINQVKEIVSLPLEKDENQFINKNIHDLDALLEEGEDDNNDESETDMQIEDSDEDNQEEEDNFLNKDIDFIIFKKNISHEPDHILRYCFSYNTSPLYYSSYQKNLPKKIKCQYCGKKKAFEFQINCTILNSFKELGKLDWGIIAVYSCYDSCFNKDLKIFEESVFVQNEPQKLTKQEIEENKQKILDMQNKQNQQQQQQKKGQKKKKIKKIKEEPKESKFQESDWIQLIIMQDQSDFLLLLKNTIQEMENKKQILSQKLFKEKELHQVVQNKISQLQNQKKIAEQKVQHQQGLLQNSETMLCQSERVLQTLQSTGKKIFSELQLKEKNWGQNFNQFKNKIRQIIQLILNLHLLYEILTFEIFFQNLIVQNEKSLGIISPSASNTNKILISLNCM